jgi:DNA-binding transcriptional LysR family regulator
VDPIDGADLAQLAALDALLTERHVTRAARRLGITQSSMSHHLARLRARFDDPLLVRVGREMAPTPRAQSMAEPLRAALSALQRVVAAAEPFDAARTARAFTLACPDLLAPALPELLAALHREAPSLVLHVVAPGPDLAAALAAGRCDVALGPTPAEAPGLVMRPLGALHWCVITRRGHPLARGRMTAAAWASHLHVQVRQNTGSPSHVGAMADRAGVRRRVALTVPGFLAVPWVVARTDMVFTAPRELVDEIAAALDLAVLRPPVELAPIAAAALWHERMQADAGHRWFRERVVAAMVARLRARRGTR